MTRIITQEQQMTQRIEILEKEIKRLFKTLDLISKILEKIIKK